MLVLLEGPRERAGPIHKGEWAWPFAQVLLDGLLDVQPNLHAEVHSQRTNTVYTNRGEGKLSIASSFPMSESMQRLNRYGDIVWPCFTPLFVKPGS